MKSYSKTKLHFKTWDVRLGRFLGVLLVAAIVYVASSFLFGPGFPQSALFWAWLSASALAVLVATFFMDVQPSISRFKPGSHALCWGFPICHGARPNGGGVYVAFSSVEGNETPVLLLADFFFFDQFSPFGPDNFFSLMRSHENRNGLIIRFRTLDTYIPRYEQDAGVYDIIPGNAWSKVRSKMGPPLGTKSKA